jgi:prepilin-type N-terminal cleavage/methylation domain-containing protein
MKRNGFSIIEMLIVVCILAIGISLTMYGWSSLKVMQTQQAVEVAAVKRKAAIDQMYDQHGISADEIWLQATKSELTRRGLAGPYELNPQTLAVYLDNLSLDPVFVVPDRYDARTLQALGLNEPE